MEVLVTGTVRVVTGVTDMVGDVIVSGAAEATLAVLVVFQYLDIVL